MRGPVDVVAIGETMGAIRAPGLLRLGGSVTLTIAGAESNVAIAVSRLGHRSRWIGRTGDDEIGRLVRRTLQAEGVGIEPSIIDGQRPTGLLLSERRVADISRVAYYRAGSAGSGLEAADVEAAFDPLPRVLHVTGVTSALSASAAEAVRHAVERAGSLGVVVSLDVNYRRALWSRAEATATLGELARQADLVFASDDELALVAEGREGDAGVELLLESGVGEVVVKQGGEGATGWSAAGPVSVPARPVPVADTIGAGDAFTAGYLSGLLDGLDQKTRLDRGAILGAFAVASPGDWEGLPHRDELQLLDQAAGTTVR